MLQLSNNLFPKALPFFFNTTSCAPAIGAKIHDVKMGSSLLLTLINTILNFPYPFFNFSVIFFKPRNSS